MDNAIPDCGPFHSLRELVERIRLRAPTMVPKINEILADHTVDNTDKSLKCWPLSQAVLNHIAAETGCVINGIRTDHGMRWSASFTEHREQLEPA